MKRSTAVWVVTGVIGLGGVATASSALASGGDETRPLPGVTVATTGRTGTTGTTAGGDVVGTAGTGDASSAPTAPAATPSASPTSHAGHSGETRAEHAADRAAHHADKAAQKAERAAQKAATKAQKAQAKAAKKAAHDAAKASHSPRSVNTPNSPRTAASPVSPVSVRTPASPPSVRQRPDMPRWKIMWSLRSVDTMPYLARRDRPVTVAPVNRCARSAGKGRRRSGRKVVTVASRCPSRKGARPRTVVSTSGSSGISSAR